VGENVLQEFEVVPALEIQGVEGIGEVIGEKVIINPTFKYGKGNHVD
jgi:hypothetical protein